MARFFLPAGAKPAAVPAVPTVVSAVNAAGYCGSDPVRKAIWYAVVPGGSTLKYHRLSLPRSVERGAIFVPDQPYDQVFLYHSGSHPATEQGVFMVPSDLPDCRGCTGHDAIYPFVRPCRQQRTGVGRSQLVHASQRVLCLHTDSEYRN